MVGKPIWLFLESNTRLAQTLFIYLFILFWLHPRHREVPGLGIDHSFSNDCSLNHCASAGTPRTMSLFFFILFFFFFFFFLWLHLWHMEVPRLGAELKLPAYATATANAGFQLRAMLIINPLSKARDRTCILTDTMSSS